MKLALLGGEKAVQSEKPKFPLITEAGYARLNQMLADEELSTSPVVLEFEERFAKYIGTEYALCSCNGTTSIQEALFAVGVGAGDEVIVPSFTFWASVGPVLACNALPVFADVDLDMQTLTAETIAKVITPKTKAIVIVHTWGNPCDMDPILKLAKEHNLKVIEDCSHAHGAEYNGRKVGSFGDIGCFSLQGSKVLAAGEGGILVTNHREYYERACALGHYERLSRPSFPEDSAYRRFAGTGLGYKHRVHPLGIAIANAGLDVLDERNAIRNENGKLMDELFSQIGYLVPQKVAEKAERVYAYHYMRYVPEKLHNLNVTTLCKALAAEGVSGGTCGYGRLHKAPFVTEEGMFGHGCPLACPHYGAKYEVNKDLPNTELLAINDLMVAPRFEGINTGIVEEYLAAYKKIEDNIDDLLEYEASLGTLDTSSLNKIGLSINAFKK